jgi:hypothetical protein
MMKYLITALLLGMVSSGPLYAGDGSAIGDERPPKPRKGDKQQDDGGWDWPDIDIGFW